VIVVDASAIVEVLLNTPQAPRIRNRLFAAGDVLAAPHLLDLEVTQALRRYRLAAELTAERAEAALQDLAALRLHRYPHNLFLPRIWELRHNMTAYDAVYVALAEALNAVLVTCDGAFASAGGHKVSVELF
jgi:predicted nucleic acid-binding protein